MNKWKIFILIVFSSTFKYGYLPFLFFIISDRLTVLSSIGIALVALAASWFIDNGFKKIYKDYKYWLGKHYSETILTKFLEFHFEYENKGDNLEEGEYIKFVLIYTLLFLIYPLVSIIIVALGFVKRIIIDKLIIIRDIFRSIVYYAKLK